jgi:hypothetical protein
MPGIVRLYHRAGLMLVAVAHVTTLLELQILLAEPGVAIAIRVGGAVLLPEQR